MPPASTFASFAAAAALAACSRVPASWTASSPVPPTCPAEGCTGDRAALIAHARTPDACPGAGEAPCAGAAAHDCTVRALAAWADAQDDRQVACVARVLADACSLGDAAGCTHAGRMWLDGRAVARDPERGLAMLDKGCEGGVLMSCMVAVRWLADEQRAVTVKDGASLRVRFDAEANCLGGSADDCASLGQQYYAGRDPFPRDRARSAIEYQRGCDLGSTLACSNLGDAYEYGDSVPRDLARAASLYDRACHAGNPLGCSNLGHLVEHGEGVARDAARARALYRDACSRGEVYGCLHAQLMALEPAGPPADPMASLERWRRACDRKEARACAFVGLIYEDGPDGLARDEAKSLQAMSRACDLGFRAGCDWLQTHGGP